MRNAAYPNETHEDLLLSSYSFIGSIHWPSEMHDNEGMHRQLNTEHLA